jgi:hypothetical protein
VKLFVNMSIAMTTTSVTVSRGLSEGPQGLLQTTDIVIDETLFAKILGTSDAHKRKHLIDFFEIENLQCKKAVEEVSRSSETSRSSHTTYRDWTTDHSIAKPNHTSAFGIVSRVWINHFVFQFSSWSLTNERSNQFFTVRPRPSIGISGS